MDERGWVAKDIYRRTNVSPAAVYRFLDAKRGIAIGPETAKNLRELACLFDVEFEYFLEARIWRVMQIARTYPELVDVYHDLITDAARAYGFYEEHTDCPREAAAERR